MLWLLLGSVLLIIAGVWIGQNRSGPTALAATGPSVDAAGTPRIAGPATGAMGTSAGPAHPADSVGIAASGPDAGTPDPGPATSATTTPPIVPHSSSPEAAPAPSPTAPVAPVLSPAIGVPVSLDIPTLGVRAPVDAVLATGGVLHPPEDPARVGWWLASAPPGGDGPTVLVGHVDSVTAGAGALLGLTDLQRGDRITVHGSDGGSADYAVSERQVHVKADGLPAALFDLGGATRLVVITCGGPFDESTGSYEDNVVVVAEPAD